MTTTTEDVSNAIIRENPLGIKIKEITKPEEIRITNENKNTVNKQISTANKAGKDANHIDKGNTTISPPTSECKLFMLYLLITCYFIIIFS